MDNHEHENLTVIDNGDYECLDCGEIIMADEIDGEDV